MDACFIGQFFSLLYGVLNVLIFIALNMVALNSVKKSEKISEKIWRIGKTSLTLQSQNGNNPKQQRLLKSSKED